MPLPWPLTVPYPSTTNHPTHLGFLCCCPPLLLLLPLPHSLGQPQVVNVMGSRSRAILALFYCYVIVTGRKA